MNRQIVWGFLMSQCWLLAPVPVGAEEAAAPSQEEAPMRLSMDFQDANLKDVLKTFSQQTGINVIASGDVGDQPVTLYFEDVTAMDALDQILHVANLTYERPPGSDIYVVTPKGPEAPLLLTRVYRLRYARVSTSILAKAAAAFGNRTPFEATLAQSSSGGGGSSAGGGSGASGGTIGGGGAAGASQEVGIDAIVKGLLTDHGAVIVDARTNRLIISDLPENFPRLEAALAALDIQTPQIMVDAEVIETTLGKIKDLGFEWGTDGSLFQLTPALRTTRAPFSTLFGEKSSAATGITLGTLNTAKAVAILKALQTDTETKILARPKVLTLDNESAVIRLTSDEAIGFTTTSQSTTGTQSSEPERTTTGVVLVVTPQVNEHGYITMIVEPSVTKTVASKISAPTGQAVPRDPKTRSARTLVRIRSGDTLVVGGLIDRSDEQSLRQVPILSGVPFLGEAFKNTDITNSASELIVFITPRILDEPTPTQLVASPSPLGLREQEPAGARQDAIEQALNQLEQP